MEPARSRDRSADVRAADALPLPASLAFNEGDLNGLVEGVGLEVFGNGDAPLLGPGPELGENLEGTVPARDRPLRGVNGWLASSGGMKSGKPS